MDNLCCLRKSVLPPSDDSKIRRVAIIGAGPSGVAAAKSLAAEAVFDRVDVYEQQSSFGGAWILSQPDEHDITPIPQTDPFGALDRVKLDGKGDVKPPIVLTPMYDRLETNIPNILMRFSEKQFPHNSLLFPKRNDVLKYISEYSQEVKHLIKFGHQVTSLTLESSSGKADVWILTHKNVKSGTLKEDKYDAVALANGHFSHISIPDTEGIRKWNEAYPGSIMHSKFYRRPEDFTGKKVVIVGNASSGIDIGVQVSATCQKPLILAARSEPLFIMPDYAEHIKKPALAAFVSPKLANRAVEFADGSIEGNVDVVLFCTGYYISFPFLEHTLADQMINTGYMVHGTYQHIFWTPHPSLAFLGLPNKVLPLPLSETQGAVLSRVWSGRLALPSKPEMQVWEHQRWQKVARMLEDKGKPAEAVNIEKAFLIMGGGQDMLYHNDMIHWASTATPGPGRPIPHPWTDREKWIRSQMAKIKKAYAERGDKKYEVRTIEELGIDYEKHMAEQNGNGV